MKETERSLKVLSATFTAHVKAFEEDYRFQEIYSIKKELRI